MVDPVALVAFVTTVALLVLTPGPDMRIVGAAYLLYLGITTLRRKPGPDRPRDLPAGPAWSTRKAFSRGLLTNLLNPKVVLFNAAFLPQFVDPSRGSTTTQLLVLGACFVLIDLLIDGPIGLFSGHLGSWLARHRRAARRLDVATGSIFIGLSARLALERR